MKEASGIAAALLSSALGGTAIVATRHTAADVGVLAVAIIRYGLGFLLILPLVFMRGERWPPLRDWPAVVGMGVLFFCLFPMLFNLSLIYTTAGRAALALATAPLLTMLMAALVKVEPLTARKAAGVVIATTGVALALISGLSETIPGAWRGDLLMMGGALGMALYTIWSRPYIRRSGSLSFCVVGMGAGVVALSLGLALGQGDTAFAGLALATPSQLGALVYLGVIGGAVMFVLWVYALAHTTPTRVVVSVTLNPLVAGLLGALLLAEPIGWNLVAGLVTVVIGIGLAATQARAQRSLPL